MCPTHVGHVQRCLFRGESCGFLTFLGISVATHVTACDVRVTSSNEVTIIAPIVLHMSCTPKTSAKKSVPVSRKMSARSEKESTLSILRRPFCDYDVSSTNHENVM